MAAEKTMEFQPRTPSVVEYNLEVQRQLISTVSIHAGYVGAYSYNLSAETQQNIRTPQIAPDGSKIFSASTPLLNPSFSTIQLLVTGSIAKYNALQMGLNKSFSHGLLLQTKYTWRKNLSNADTTQNNLVPSSAGNVMDVHDFGRDYGYSVYDQRQSFLFSTRYKLPVSDLLKSKIAQATVEGWEVNSIVHVGSGLPIDVRDGFNYSLNGDATAPDRPNLLPGFSNSPTHGTTGAGCPGVRPNQKLGTPDLWFNPCAFALSDLGPGTLGKLGTFGNVGKDTLIGPPVFNVDFGLAKNFAVRERMNLEFRAEFFNIFNHAYFQSPVNALFSSDGRRSGNAGRITSTAIGNREIQMGLKLTF